MTLSRKDRGFVLGLGMNNFGQDKASIHDWVKRRKPRKGYCSRCYKICRTHFANTNGHVYRRRIKDYIELCPACHGLFDRNGQVWPEDSDGDS